jgi:predicted short-subunit dehydrogenase-like oxidoreductase (DUF2520 family)
LSVHFRSISFAGAGNVATHLARAFHKAGYSVSGIYSPGLASAKELAAEVNSRVCQSVKDIDRQTDMIIVSVPDHAFSEVLDALGQTQTYVVHTSGGLDLNVMKGKVANYGVLYPLQTFSKNTPVNMQEVPFCIEASDKKLLQELQVLASSVSGSVIEADSEKRKILHLSAVFACNFPNSMYAIAAELLKSADLPFGLLHPLILETARKATMQPPLKAQTGPAHRNDLETMKTHEAMLENKELYRHIYALLSGLIQEQYKEDDV